MLQPGGEMRSFAWRLSALTRSGRLVLVAFVAVLASSFFAAPAQAQSIKKTIDRNFPVFFYCPIDPAATLTFTATGTEAILSFAADNFTGPTWNAMAVDNVAVVPQSVFNVPANQVVSHGYETCYIPPGIPSTPGYDFVAGSPEAYLNLFDTNAAG